MAWFDTDVVHDPESARTLAAELAATADDLDGRVERLDGTASTARDGWVGTAAERFDRGHHGAQRAAREVATDLRRVAAEVLDRLADARADQVHRERLRERVRHLPAGVR